MKDASREHELFEELKSARLAKRKALEAMLEAKSIYLERRQAHGKAAGVVEEILTEIETGRSGRPIIDAVNGRGADQPATPDGSPPRSGFDLVTSRPAPRKGRKPKP